MLTWGKIWKMVFCWKLSNSIFSTPSGDAPPSNPPPGYQTNHKTTYRSFLNALCRDVISHTFKNSQENLFQWRRRSTRCLSTPTRGLRPVVTPSTMVSSILLPWIVFKYLSYRWPARQPGGDWDWGDPPSPHVLLPLSPNQTHPPTSQGAQSTPGKIKKN